MPANQPASERSDLAGMAAVVTGSSSGIGREIALALAATGADVLVHAGHRREEAEATADQVQACGRDAHVEVIDLTSHENQNALVARAWQWRAIEVWVNCAGADVLTGDAADWSFEQKLDVLWRVDVTATIRLSRLVGQRMKERGRGAILNVGWDRAAYGMEGDSGEMFAATKGAVMAFSRSLARSLAPEVRVNCIAPGWIKTAWGEEASDSWQQRATGDALLGRWGTPQDVAQVARFLASPSAEFITGQIIEINGGLKHP
ncbi:MAG: SDR family oxidoreductase [Pirellulales bacterium]